MKASARHCPTRASFTLIELLLVLAVVGALAGLLGMAFSSQRPSLALQAGQGALRAALALTRAHAAQSEGDAFLVVEVADPGSPGFLRVLRVLVRTPTEPDPWRLAGLPVELPSTVLLVPAPSLPGVFFPAGWPPLLHSTALQSSALEGLPEGFLALARFTAVGTLADGTGAWLVVGVAHRGPDGIVFTPAVRGLTVSAYGVVVDADMSAAAAP